MSAADLLERQAAPVPVAASERLLGPEDCDAEGRCWWFCTECPGEHPFFLRSISMTDTPNRPPLWEVMHEARVLGEADRFTKAAEIRALRDWLLPEEKAPTLMRGPDLERLCARQHLRALLTTEADRAERAE